MPDRLEYQLAGKLHLPAYIRLAGNNPEICVPQCRSWRTEYRVIKYIEHCHSKLQFQLLGDQEGL